MAKITTNKTMEPKDKAKELFEKFRNCFPVDEPNEREYAKQCALIAVKEILGSVPLEPSDVDWDDCGSSHQYWYRTRIEESGKYWDEVKSEIEKL